MSTGDLGVAWTQPHVEVLRGPDGRPEASVSTKVDVEALEAAAALAGLGAVTVQLRMRRWRRTTLSVALNVHADDPRRIVRWRSVEVTAEADLPLVVHQLVHPNPTWAPADGECVAALAALAAQEWALLTAAEVLRAVLTKVFENVEAWVD